MTNKEKVLEAARVIKEEIGMSEHSIPRVAEIIEGVLTWQDIRTIVKIADHIVTQETGKYGNEEEYYKEVLKRFKEVNI